MTSGSPRPVTFYSWPPVETILLNMNNGLRGNLTSVFDKPMVFTGEMDCKVFRRGAFAECEGAVLTIKRRADPRDRENPSH
jgi:hypothetical protein